MAATKSAKPTTPTQCADVVAVDERQREPVVGGALGQRRRPAPSADRAASAAPARPSAARLRVAARACVGRGGKRAAATQAAADREDADDEEWAASGTPSTAAIGTPSAAPANVPRLQPAWNRGMIVRPSRRSTSAPSTFIATSQVPVPNAVAEEPDRGRRPRPRRWRGLAATTRPSSTTGAAAARRRPRRTARSGAAAGMRHHRADRDREQQQPEPAVDRSSALRMSGTRETSDGEAEAR